MKLKSPYILTFAILLASSSWSFAATPNLTIGWEEQVVMSPEQLNVMADMDTSSETSSIVAGNILPFDKNGEKWVKFTVQVTKGITGGMSDIPFERKILRSEKNKGVIGGGGHRQIVHIALCIGDKIYMGEFALKGHSKKDSVVTLGRDALQHIGALVDPALVNLIKPSCSEAAMKSAT